MAKAKKVPENSALALKKAELDHWHEYLAGQGVTAEQIADGSHKYADTLAFLENEIAELKKKPAAAEVVE
jgi:hypothetical protein